MVFLNENDTLAHFLDIKSFLNTLSTHNFILIKILYIS